MMSQDVNMYSNTEFNFKSLQEVLISFWKYIIIKEQRWVYYDFLNNNYITLEDENIIMKKVQYMEHIVSHCLKELPDADIDANLLHIFMPQVKSVLEKVGTNK